MAAVRVNPVGSPEVGADWSRYCAKCERTLPVEAFAGDQSKASGWKSICLECDRAKSRVYYERAGRERKLAAYAALAVERDSRPPRLCRCGAETISRRHKYCAVCREQTSWYLKHERERVRSRVRDRERPSSSGRGYGWMHQSRRKVLAPFVAAGVTLCARCGHPILAGEPWDLGHVDGSRSSYAGPEHRRCNRATAAHGRKPRVSRWW